MLRAKGIRVEVDDTSNRMQNKIRLAQEQKVPYMLVLGDREIEARTAAPRTRGGEQLPRLAGTNWGIVWRGRRQLVGRTERHATN